MNKWNQYYELIKFPLKLLFLAIMCFGIGNILTNQAFSSLWLIRNEYVLFVAELLMRFSQFTIIYFPILILIRLVSRNKNGHVTITMGLSGFITYLVTTMFTAPTNLTTSAYSAILGLSLNNSRIESLSGSVHYPLQTGIIGVILVIMATRFSYNKAKDHTEYSLLGFLDRDMYGIIYNNILCVAIGIGVGIVWPVLIDVIGEIITFITKDSNNPMNLFIYGVVERVLNVLNLGNLIRTPFWFQANGGTIISMVGETVAGDVNAWTASLGGMTASSTVGKYITPYYILNIFAVPGMVLGMYSLYTDKMEKRKVRFVLFLIILVSMFTGTTLPLELFLILLCPLLWVFHVVYTGCLYGLLHALGVYLGFNYTGTSPSTLTAFPGTLLELITYVRISSMQRTLVFVLIIGIASAIIYFVFTRFYFKHLALDLVNTGGVQRLVQGTLEAVGGAGNIKMIHSSIDKLTIQLFDPTLLQQDRLFRLGASQITNSKAGFIIRYGACSTLVRNGLNERMRESLREG